MDWNSSVDSIALTHASLAAELRPMRFLSNILDWWKSAGRDITSIDFISQDEFTIDVVVPLSSSSWLVLDCT